MFRKLSSQLFLAFLSISLLSLVQAYFNLQLAHNKEQVENITNQIHSIETNVLEQAKLVNNFFTFDVCKDDFFITQQSKYLKERKMHHQQFNRYTQALSKNKIYQKIDTCQHFLSLAKLADLLELYIDSSATLIYQRGFKDYGLEGKMRIHAHSLEESGCINISDILMLRRHEKDYIIRNEQKYINKFNELVDKVMPTITAKQCKEELELYRGTFNSIVEIDRKIGTKNNTAQRLKIEHIISAMMIQTQQIDLLCKTYRDQIYQELRMGSILILLLIMSIGLSLSIILSRIATKRITLLSAGISAFVKSGFTNICPINVEIRKDEIGILINNFELMQSEICNLINYLEETVAERTEEINVQKEHILKQNRKIMDSIKYAQNIQEAILSPSAALASSVPNHFIFFQPKDIVSGDFYWHKHIQNEELNISIIAVADCTGHGVPGGLMSMLGIASLNDITLEKPDKSAADVLYLLRTKITNTLATKINGQLLKDGMDIALVLINHSSNTLQFSGARRPLYFIRDGNLSKIKGDSMPIGRYYNDNPFTLHEIALQEGDTFYLCTDGFVDQYNKALNKKYLEKNFRTFLTSIHDKPLEKQKDLFANELDQWQSDAEQTDDILVIGFKV